jgi:hypothetical protein
MISRRVLLAAAAATAVASGSISVAQAQTEIQWWHAMGGQLGEALNELAEGFNKSQKDYKVVPVYKGTYTETMTGAIAAYRAKQPPHIVQVFEVGTATMMAAKGAIYPVHQLMADAGEKFNPSDFLGAVYGYYSTTDGKLLSMPFNSSTPVLWSSIPRSCSLPATTADSPRNGRPGRRSKISAPGTTFRLLPRPTASAARTSSSRSTIRCACATSRTWRSGRRRKSSSMPAARVSRTPNSPAANVR